MKNNKFIHVKTQNAWSSTDTKKWKNKSQIVNSYTWLTEARQQIDSKMHKKKNNIWNMNNRLDNYFTKEKLEIR